MKASATDDTTPEIPSSSKPDVNPAPPVTSRRTEYSSNIKTDQVTQAPSSATERNLSVRPQLKPKPQGLSSAGKLPQHNPTLTSEFKGSNTGAGVTPSSVSDTSTIEGKEKKAPPPPPKKPARSKAILNEPAALRQHSTHQKPYQGSESSSVAERRWSSNHPDFKTPPLKMGSAGKLPQHNPSLTAEPKAGISHAFAKDSDLIETGNVEGKGRKGPPPPVAKKPDASLRKPYHGQSASSEPTINQPRKTQVASVNKNNSDLRTSALPHIQKHHALPQLNDTEQLSAASQAQPLEEEKKTAPPPPPPRYKPGLRDRLQAEASADSAEKRNPRQELQSLQEKPKMAPPSPHPFMTTSQSDKQLSDEQKDQIHMLHQEVMADIRNLNKVLADR
ncbi:hypothetical protein [Endozoicomonas atrinae]|uniref:hypothetical protein n=1 Tax=Endozoicomonas atrinae TaxID=1333660 RepID=UPI003B000529